MDESVKETNEESHRPVGPQARREPKVEIFGESVDSHDVDNDYEDRFHFHQHHHHHHHGSLAWGLALVLIGVLFLLSNFGALPPIVLTQILHLWPMLIILIGLDVLIGHSERRQNFNETDDILMKKVAMAFKYGLNPIFLIQNQTDLIPQGTQVVAYEPSFAIGCSLLPPFDGLHERAGLQAATVVLPLPRP